MKKFLKITFFGLLLWIIGFVLGFAVWPIHESNFMLFKTIMLVSSILYGMILLIIYFNKVQSDYLNEGIIVGINWFIVNLLLDLLVLVLIFKTPVGQYFIEVGIRYLNIPVITIGVGFLLSKKIK
jgi:hypothetical protein